MGRTFRDMSPAQCRERIARGGVGRVVWCVNGRPRVQPVNYTVVDDDIVFRTAPYTDLGMHVAGRPVAFEVDEIDHDTESGWSVVVHGEARVVQDPDETLRLRRSGPQPWAEGQRSLVVRLRPQRTTGRTVGEVEAPGRSAG